MIGVGTLVGAAGAAAEAHGDALNKEADKLAGEPGQVITLPEITIVGIPTVTIPTVVIGPDDPPEPDDPPDDEPEPDKPDDEPEPDKPDDGDHGDEPGPDDKPNPDEMPNPEDPGGGGPASRPGDYYPAPDDPGGGGPNPWSHLYYPNPEGDGGGGGPAGMWSTALSDQPIQGVRVNAVMLTGPGLTAFVTQVGDNLFRY